MAEGTAFLLIPGALPGLGRRPMAAQGPHSNPFLDLKPEVFFFSFDPWRFAWPLHPCHQDAGYFLDTSLDLYGSIGLFQAQNLPSFRKKPIHVHLLIRKTGDNVDLS